MPNGRENETRTLQIGDELIRIARDVVMLGTEIKIAQFGTLQEYIVSTTFSPTLPALLLNPWLFHSDVRNASPPTFKNVEVYRALYLREIAPGTQAMRAIAIDVAEIVKQWGIAFKLSSIDLGLPKQVEMSMTSDVEWNPEEDKFTSVFKVPVKCAVIVQRVSWYT